MKVILTNSAADAAKKGAEIIKAEILRKPDLILGLATGSTPILMYNELREMYKKGELDFSQVRSFNLDEYYPIKKSDPQSYDYFMREHLFSHINIKNTLIPNGQAEDPQAECEAYEKEILKAGGIDLQVLGIGVNGHIGFNEPEEELYLKTHLTRLTPSTIEVNARFFENPSDVPHKALTMGMGTIMSAGKILLLITGKAKAEAAKKLLSGRISTACPATFLTLHKDTVVIIDKEAGELI